MADASLLSCVCVCALAGSGVGFLAGLVPGLHMNNVAAILSAYAAACIGIFGGLAKTIGTSSVGVAVSSFLSAAMVAHILAESVTSAYVGIPSGDVVSVLPAHRLARSGLGRSAVRASVDGALAGVIAATIILVPVCLLMGRPMRFYDILKQAMGVIVIFFSSVLIASEGARQSSPGRSRSRLVRMLRGALIFVASGVLGLIVLKTEFYSRSLTDLPWMGAVIPRDSLLLPMFAGLFGIPSLLLSMGSVQVFDIRVSRHCVYLHRPGAKDVVLSLFGGGVVGWMPGMTSGAAATLCVPTIQETARKEDIPSSLRFIWLYSSISASGAVFSLGALFTIMKARSGTMDAIETFLTSENIGWPANLQLMLSLAMAMLMSALIAHSLLRMMDSRMRHVRNIMSSKTVAIAAFIFILALSVGLTGMRGAMILTTSVMLGLLPPLAGVRRIQLMGCLLVPIGMTLVAMM